MTASADDGDQDADLENGRSAFAAADHILAGSNEPLLAAECELWDYGVGTLTGIKGNWGAFDLERIHQRWLDALRRKRAGD